MPTAAAMRFASALSDAPTTAAALEQIINELTRKLPATAPGSDSRRADLVVVFASPHHSDGFNLIHERLAGALAPSVEVGVTAEGVIGVRQELQERPGLSVLAAQLPGAVLTPFVHDEANWSAWQGKAVGSGGVKAIILLPDPFTTPMSRVLGSLAETFPGVPVVGGMASGAGQPGGNRLLINGRVLREGAVGVLLGGAIRADCTVSQGCRPIGRPLVITKSQRNVLQELGGKKALPLVQDMIRSLPEDDTAKLQSHGLFVGRVINEYKERFGRGDFLIRGVIGVDQDAGYIAINDPLVRVGQTVQFHVRDARTAEEDFRLLLEMQRLEGTNEDAADGASAGGALLFSCNGRGTRLFEQPDADARMVHDALGDLPLAGFFAAGELGPVGEQNFLHGHTASLVVLRPAE